MTQQWTHDEIIEAANRKAEKYTPDAAHMGRKYPGPVNLDNASPMDIYELFEKVTGYDYGDNLRVDELLILSIASAYETAHNHYHPENTTVA